MIAQVIFRAEALEDVVEAAGWYEERSPGLGEELIDEILLATDRAARDPEFSESFGAKARCVAS